MNYEIIATLGPASRDEATWRAMLDSGVNAFRLNTSHLSLDDVQAWLSRLQPFTGQAGIVLDLQGSKWRLGEFPPFTLNAGQQVTLIQAERSTQPGVLPVPHADFFSAIGSSNGEIILNDARQRLQVEQPGAGGLTACVMLGGQILPHKGITLADTTFRSEALSEKDRAITSLARQGPGVHLAISYIRDALEMKRYRDLLGADARLIAKIERGPAVEDLAGIASTASELWICRGDLGAELGLPGMAAAVHHITGQLPGLPVPVVLAGQVLEHLSASPVPTRAEVCDLYNALAAGYRGLVLSDETAMGQYPLQAVRAAAMFRA